MVFLFSVNFPERRMVKKALQSFFGIGPNVSARLLAKHHLHDTCRVGELANTQILEINATLTEMKIENDLRRQVLGNIARLRDTGTYRGKRHAMGLPVRGQRTKNQTITAWKLNKIDRKL
ncbi:hypothetical protein GJ744_007603 [Endocarpon pusillum]|uniref:40S ribosomal protein S13 n=1 Tax=Endocarpon pusillum TaxID=364733 RepID=A0A8H7AKN8_9EURO|nr:hypothetical protein GJ744_007603 [Endocarpon pusillum]